MPAHPLSKANTAPKRISILGATGSVGGSTLDIVRQQRDAYDVVALSAQDNVDRLIEIAREFQPTLAVIGNEAHYTTLKAGLANTKIEVAAGDEALLEAAARPTDWVMAAIVGAAGLRPTLKAIEQGVQLAFANKECLVCAGELMLQACRMHGATLLPVDSEHNAIFQVFDFEQPQQVEKIVLTASGGPFLHATREQMEAATLQEAVRHPNWSMGAKISIDSATMMNKGLELIEAYHLFPLAQEQIEVVVHPESIIHSMVHYRDGSVLAQMGMPDMRIPIAYTLGWPQRVAVHTPKLDLVTIGSLRFERPDEQRFPALRLAREALRAGQYATTALNAANEVAVAQFMDGAVRLTQIAEIVQATLEKLAPCPMLSVEDVIACDAQARETALRVVREEM